MNNKTKEFGAIGMGGTEFLKGARNGIISIVGAFFGYFVYIKLGLEFSPDIQAAIESISTILGAIFFHYLNYFFNLMRI